MLQFSHWKQMGGGDTRILHFQHLSFLLLCGGLTNSLSLRTAERISDSSLKRSFDVEKTLHRDKEVRPRSIDALSPVPFHSTKETKPKTFTSALQAAVIKNVQHSLSHLKGVICTLFLYKPQPPSATAKLSKSCVGQCTKFVIQAESTETQVPNTERALFILKKCSTTLAN